MLSSLEKSDRNNGDRFDPYTIRKISTNPHSRNVLCLSYDVKEDMSIDGVTEKTIPSFYLTFTFSVLYIRVMEKKLNHCSKCRSVILQMRSSFSYSSNTTFYYVVCWDCGKIGNFADTEEEAIQNWNKKNRGLTNAEKNYWFSQD
jgi:hypothetical protein